MSAFSTEGPDYQSRTEVEGVGSTLVYVPGIDGTGSLFYRQRPLLQAAGFRVVTYRLRDAALSMETLVDDLARVLDGAGAKGPVTLVGESFGGALSMSFAVAHASRVSQLVILNSFPYFRPQIRLRLAVWGLSVVPWKTMELVRRVTAFRLHSRHTSKHEMRRFLELTAATTKAGYINRLRILRGYDLRDRLPRVQIPTLFLAADQDRFVPSVAQARLMENLTPNGRMRVLQGHGHICLIAPDLDLAALIAEWKDDHGASRSIQKEPSEKNS
ncbi:MAG: alpha/beta fold hydrolase [Longimicrobiales bacterium]